MSDTCPEIDCCNPFLLDAYSLVNFPVYTNEEVTIFVPCPEGYTCEVPGVSITIPAGSHHYRPTTPEENTPENVQDQLNNQTQNDATNQALPQLNPHQTIYTNDAMVVSCSDGRVGDHAAVPFFTGPGQITVPAGMFASLASKAAANALAQAFANNLLSQYADCHWENVEVTCTCGEGQIGGPFTVPAGTYKSYISQADADQQAQDDCLDQQLDPVTGCRWVNVEKTCDCAPDQQGGPFTVPAGTYSSQLSQEDADAQAEADCEDQAIAGCYWSNDEVNCDCPSGEVGGPFTVAAGLYTSQVSKEDANAQAEAACQQEVDDVCYVPCSQTRVDTLTWIHTGGGGTGSGSGGSGHVEIPNGAPSGSTLTSNIVSNTCGSVINLTAEFSGTLKMRDINNSRHTGSAQIIVVVNGSVISNPIFNATTTYCGNNFCPVEDFPFSLSHSFTVPAGQTFQLVFAIGHAQDNQCPGQDSNGQFTVTGT